MDKICEYCGKPIENATVRQKYHSECSYKAAEERRKAKKEQKLQTANCARCGVEIFKGSTPRKYCPECAEIVHKEQIKTAQKRLINGTSIRPKTKPKISYLKKEQPKLTLAEVDRLAKAEGLSYGEYSAKHGLYESVYKRNGWL